ncbi:MAG: right-handed parallel beta-helix repeat-containing protein [Myxococcales bacterium]|nr:right-handed parallel beta-helix repeat-containing protein [Myxococcales bacterium]
MLRAFGLVFLAGCSAGPATSFEAYRGPEGPGYYCPPRFEVDAERRGCLPVLPASPCPAGTMPVLGEATCAPVGVRACPAWAETDPSGWGCREKLPVSDCAGATMEKLGSTACVPIGDCNQPFPPAGATLFVDDSYPAGQLDATHFATIAAALAAATAGAVIAVEAGTYPESLFPRVPLRIAGRCAERVSLTGRGGPEPGIQPFRNVGVVEISGMTISGQRGGVVALEGNDVRVADCLLTQNRDSGLVVVGGKATVRSSRISDSLPAANGDLGFGVWASLGGRAELDGVAVTGNVKNGVVIKDANSTGRVSGSVVRNTRLDPTGHAGKGVEAGFGGSVEVAGSALVSNHSANFAVMSASRGTVADSVLRDGRADQLGRFGHGVEVDSGSTVTIERSTLSENREWALVALQQSTSAKLIDTTVRGPAASTGLAGGLTAQYGAALELTGSAVVEAGTVGLRLEESRGSMTRSLVRGTRYQTAVNAGLGQGVIAGFASSFSATEAALLDNQSAGLVAGGPGAAPSEALLQYVVAAGTRADSNGDFGYGVEASDGALLELHYSVALANAGAGVVIGLTGTRATIREVVSLGHGGARSGHGLVCADGATARVLGGTFRDNSGIGLAFGRCSGTVERGFVAANGVGIHAQGGTVIEEVEAVGDPLPNVVRVSSATRFLDNQSRTGTGTVTLPSTHGLQR